MNSSIDGVTLATDGCGVLSIELGAFKSGLLPIGGRVSMDRIALGVNVLPERHPVLSTPVALGRRQSLEMMAEDADTISFKDSRPFGPSLHLV